MKRLLLGLLCLLLSCVAMSAGLDAVRKRAEAGMRVTGSIIVAPDGSVQSYAIDQADKLPPNVVELLRKNVPTWKFEPITLDGKAVLAKAKMSLRIVAKWSDDKNYSIGITRAQFSQDHEVAGETISYKKRDAPVYPYLAIRMGVSGTVYLLLRVDRQGQVKDAVAQQVDLDFAASDSEMEKWQGELAYSALDTAKLWTFNIPTFGKHANDKYWVVQVPVIFLLHKEEYGQWKSYIPGPLQAVPWLGKSSLISANMDALPAEGIYQVDQDLQLVTPLDGA